MAGFRLKLNRLKDISYASSVQVTLAFEQPFEMEYAYCGQWNLVMVKPILLQSVVIFLIQFTEGGADPMALVYNAREEWSDIEKESTRETSAIGLAIENHYSNRYLLSAPSHVLN
ncbi:MAG TPA: hypothetical protein VMH27_15040 [Puia sp.]|nr:hypothetical protein [Puia sp.]